MAPERSNAPVNVTIPSGQGTATEYYGDESASASTTISAVNGVTTWGTANVTITATRLTNDTLSVVSGTPQSATVGTAFTNPLVVKDLDQYGNAVQPA